MQFVRSAPEGFVYFRTATMTTDLLEAPATEKPPVLEQGKSSPELQSYYRQHAIQRARERYGVELSVVDYELLNLSIIRAEAKYIGRLSARRRLWLVRHGQVYMKALYDKIHHQIMTFILPDPE